MVIGIPVNKVETAEIKLPGISYLQMTWNLHNAYRTFACAVKLWPFLWHCARCALVSRSDSKLAKLDLMIMISWKKSTNSFWMTEWGDIHIVLKTDTSAEWSCSHGLPRAPVFGSEKYLRIICMSHSQMLGKVEYGLPAKIWRLVGCTEMLSW